MALTDQDKTLMTRNDFNALDSYQPDPAAVKLEQESEEEQRRKAHPLLDALMLMLQDTDPQLEMDIKKYLQRRSDDNTDMDPERANLIEMQLRRLIRAFSTMLDAEKHAFHQQEHNQFFTNATNNLNSAFNNVASSNQQKTTLEKIADNINSFSSTPDAPLKTQPNTNRGFAYQSSNANQPQSHLNSQADPAKMKTQQPAYQQTASALPTTNKSMTPTPKPQPGLTRKQFDQRYPNASAIPVARPTSYDPNIPMADVVNTNTQQPIPTAQVAPTNTQPNAQASTVPANNASAIPVARPTSYDPNIPMADIVNTNTQQPIPTAQVVSNNSVDPAQIKSSLPKPKPMSKKEFDNRYPGASAPSISDITPTANKQATNDRISSLQQSSNNKSQRSIKSPASLPKLIPGGGKGGI